MAWLTLLCTIVSYLAMRHGLMLSLLLTVGALALMAYLGLGYASRSGSTQAFWILRVAGVLGLFAIWAGCLVAPQFHDRADPSFYVAAAQIVPVLLLALVVEMRAVDRLAFDYGSWLMIALVVMGFAVGEIEALRAVWNPSVSPDGGYIVAAIVSGMLGVMHLAITDAALPPDSNGARRRAVRGSDGA